MRRSHARRWFVWSGLVATIAVMMTAACGSPVQQASTSTTTAATTTTATSTSRGAVAGGIVFFLTSQVNDPGGPYLTAVWRSTATDPGGAVAALLGGPDRSGEFASAAITTAVPADTRLLSVGVSGTTATVNLSGQFAGGGGSTSMFGRLGQLVYTVTAQPGIQRVSLELDGQPVRTFSSEGIVLEEPIARDLVFDSGVVPPVLVEHPAIGESVNSPVRLSGYAHRLVGGRFAWSLTRGGEDRVLDGSVSVPNSEGTFATSITPPAGQTGRFDLVVQAKNAAGGNAFVRQLPFTVVP